MPNSLSPDQQLESLFEVSTTTAPSMEKYKIGLVITSYNRPRYLHRTLSHLKRSDLSEAVVILVDDGSENPHTRKLIRSFHLGKTPLIVAVRKSRKDCCIHENLLFGWEYLQHQFNFKYLTNLDSDALVKADWLAQLETLCQQQADTDQRVVVTGFNAYQHPVSREADTYCEKRIIGGINLFFQAAIYETAIRNHLNDLHWDQYLVKAFQEQRQPFYFTKPSVIQHIGRAGIWSNPGSGIYDFAIDFGSTGLVKRLASTLYYRSCRKILYTLAPLVSITGRGLKKLNGLPAKPTAKLKALFSSATHSAQRAWFSCRYRNLYR